MEANKCSQQTSQQSQSAVNNSNEFNSRLERIHRALGTSNNSAIAKALGIKQPSVAGAIKRRQIPPLWFIKIAEDYGISADWLLFGEGLSSREERESREVPLIEAHQKKVAMTIQNLLSAAELIESLINKDNQRIPLSEFEKMKLKSIVEKDTWEKLKKAIWETVTLMIQFFPKMREK